MVIRKGSGVVFSVSVNYFLNFNKVTYRYSLIMFFFFILSVTEELLNKYTFFTETNIFFLLKCHSTL